MPVDIQSDRASLKHPKGPSAEILFYGASVISWKSGSLTNPEPVERLFTSAKAALDGSKPVRGGIPVVFPCFGPPTHPDHAKLPQHGFARNNIWTYNATVMDTDAGVSVRLSRCMRHMWICPRAHQEARSSGTECIHQGAIRSSI
ncbi:hypothetical protein V8D89_010083 [Ganoderma adspersum]